MPPWYYKTITGNMTDDELNRMGKEGWELCVFVPNRMAWIFKRNDRA